MKNKIIQLYLPFLEMKFDDNFSISVWNNEFDEVFILKDKFLKKCKEMNIKYHDDFNGSLYLVFNECKCEECWAECYCDDECPHHRQITVTDDDECVVFEKFYYEIIQI